MMSMEEMSFFNVETHKLLASLKKKKSMLSNKRKEKKKKKNGLTLTQWKTRVYNE